MGKKAVSVVAVLGMQWAMEVAKLAARGVGCWGKRFAGANATASESSREVQAA